MKTTKAAVIDEDACLCCPSCHERYIHHTYIKIYQREHEDAPSQLQQINPLDKPKLLGQKPYFSDRNPSLRRDGIRVGFWCETCDDHFELKIAQHKGLTLVDFDVWPNGRIAETLNDWDYE